MLFCHIYTFGKIYIAFDAFLNVNNGTYRVLEVNGKKF